MSEHYPTDYRVDANYLDDEKLVIPAWAWLVFIVIISLVLIVR